MLQQVEGAENWPTSDMPRPLPPAFVNMPGRPKTQRRREQGEEPKGTKLSKVGIKMSCRLCCKTDHYSRSCPKTQKVAARKMLTSKEIGPGRERCQKLLVLALVLGQVVGPTT